jgi:hypothetical protein
VTARRLAWAVAAFAFAIALSSAARAQNLQPPPRIAPYPYPPPPASSPPASSLPSTPIMPPSPGPRAPSDEGDDSGLGLEWVWVNADIGAAYVNMRSFSATNLALVTTESGGPVFGVAAGIRLLFLSLGARVRDLSLSNIGNLWELSLEAKLHTRIWRIDPYFGVRGGYNFVGSLNSSAVTAATGSPSPDVNVHGFNVGPVVGIDLYLAKIVSIGVDLDVQFLFLQRPPPPLPAGVTVALLPPNDQTLYQNSGSSLGLAVSPTAHLGIHF